MMRTLIRAGIGAGLVGLSLFGSVGFFPGILVQSMSYAEDSKVILDLKVADIDQLQKLPGITNSLARRIIDHREKNGQFTRRDDLQAILPCSVYEGIKDLIEVGPRNAQEAKADPSPERGRTGQNVAFIVVVLALIGGIYLTFHEIQCEELWVNRCWNLVRAGVWAILGILCLLWAWNIDFALPPKGATCDKAKETAPSVEFFTTNQATLLTLIVALAAYTSTVEQLLRGKIRQRNTSNTSRLRHRVNLKYMYRTDIVLVLAGAALIWRMSLSAFGHHDVNLDRFNIGLLAWIILYFCTNHIRLLILAALENQTDGPQYYQDH